MREVAAMATQARYLPNDLRLTRRAGQGPTVVLMHGLYASAGVFRPMRRRLEQSLDVSSYSLSYRPGPGVEELSKRVRSLIADIQRDAPIVLVGHSLGGLVVRHYASAAACDSRVARTVSLASPFLGSSRNWMVPGQAGQDIAAGSSILERLRANSLENTRVPHLTLVAEEDDMIVPGAYPHFGEHRLVARVGHNGILFSDEAIRLVVEAVRQQSALAKS